MTSSRTSSSFVGAWTISANPANATMPICVSVVLALDERRGGLLGGDEPVGRDVGRAHAPRHVHREDDRRPAGRAPRRSPPAGPSRRRGCRARRGTARTAGGAGPATTAGRPRGRATGSRTARRSAADGAPRCGRRRAAADDRSRSSGQRSVMRPQEASWHPPEPAQRQQAADRASSTNPTTANSDGQLERLGADDEPAADVVVDRGSGRPGRRPRSTCRRSCSAMPWSVGLVELGVDLEALDLERRARPPCRSPTVSMRMPAVLGRLGRLERIRARRCSRRRSAAR